MTYVVGCGNIGALIGSALKKQSFNVTFILRNSKRLEQFKSLGSQVTVKNRKSNEFLTQTFEAKTAEQLLGENISVNGNYSLASHLDSLVSGNELTTIENQMYIENLVVATKAQETVDSIVPLLPLLNKSTTVLFVQNGAGALETLYHRFFSKVPTARKPVNIYQGIINHGVYRLDPSRYEFVHTSANDGELKIGRFIPAREIVADHHQLSPIIKSLLRTDLNASYYEDALKFQMAYFEKLIVNSVVNPLTTLLECRNGDFLKTSRFRRLISELIIEDINILKYSYFRSRDSKYSISDLGFVDNVLNERRLMSIILQTLKITEHNYSSMLQDYKLNRNSLEIDYLNGFFVKLNPSRAARNRMIIDMIKTKQDLRDYQANFPNF